MQRCESIFNGPRSLFNILGLHIQRWKITSRVNFQPASKFFVTPAVDYFSFFFEVGIHNFLFLYKVYVNWWFCLHMNYSKTYFLNEMYKESPNQLRSKWSCIRKILIIFHLKVMCLNKTWSLLQKKCNTYILLINLL